MICWKVIFFKNLFIVYLPHHLWGLILNENLQRVHSFRISSQQDGPSPTGQTCPLLQGEFQVQGICGLVPKSLKGQPWPASSFLWPVEVSLGVQLICEMKFPSTWDNKINCSRGIINITIFSTFLVNKKHISLWLCWYKHGYEPKLKQEVLLITFFQFDQK